MRYPKTPSLAGIRLCVKRFVGAAVLLMALSATAVAHARQHKPPKPLHKNAPHPYTKHEAAKHPKAIHAKR
jgi:hypothetical protein